MDNTSIAKFRFNGFTIRKSTIDIKGESIISPEMSLKIDLNGEHFVKECAFTLYMKVSITNKDKSIKVTTEAVARYVFIEVRRRTTSFSLIDIYGTACVNKMS